MIDSQLLAIEMTIKGSSKITITGYVLIILRRRTFAAPQILAFMPYVREANKVKSIAGGTYSLSREIDLKEASNRWLALSTVSQDQCRMIRTKLLSLIQVCYSGS